MSLSSIAVEQREREAKKLKSFLAFGIIGSLALHIGVLSMNIGNLTKKVTEAKDEPLEIEIVELPDTPKPEIKQIPPAKISSTNNSDDGAIALTREVTPTKAFKQPAPSKPVVKADNQPIAVAPIKVESLKTQPPQQKVAPTPKTPVNRQPAPAEIATQPKPQPAPVETTSPPIVSASPKPAPAIQKAPVAVNRPESNPTLAPQQSDRQLRNLLTSTRNAQTKPSNSVAVSKPSAVGDRQTSNIANNSQNRAESNAASTTRATSNSGAQISTGSTSSNNANSGRVPTGSRSRIATGSPSRNNGTTTSRRSGSTVATGAQNSRPTNNNSGAGSRGSDGLACVSCSKPKYPAKARRRGLEGNTEISVDVDSKGNVTNVRLARSSGHSELDKAAIEEAKRWKLKPKNGGARGVTAKVDFAIEGSERSRKRQERRKKRQQTEQRRTTPTTETANAATPTRRIRRNMTPTQNATAPRRTQTTTTRQQVDTSPPRRTQTNISRRRVDTLPPRRTGDVPQRQRQRAATPQANNQSRLRQSLRRQRPNSNSSTSQTKLRQSLRQLRQNPQPATSPANE